MNTLEFAKEIPAQKLAEIFKNYFEQHMAVYDMLKGTRFISINSIDMDSASIIYSIKMLDDNDKNILLNKFKGSSASLTIYGKVYTPNIYMNGDLLCIMIKS